MIRFKRTAMVALLTGLGFTGTSQAALFDRGGGLIYDDINNVTWLQDANGCD
jgi:chemotaxis response regulator CheB